MTDITSTKEPLEPTGIKRYVPLLVYVIVILTVLFIPLKVISYGYLPPDDALRHAAKAVSGKPWSEILVLGPAYKVDHNFGWHAILREIYLHVLPKEAAEKSTEQLVIIEVVLMFVLLGWAGVPWLRRPEAWLLTILLYAVAGSEFMRFFLGRPFLLSIFTLTTILFLWRQRSPNPPGWGLGLGMAAMITVAIFVHGVWYLWSLPLLAFLMAREFRWAVVFGCSWAVATFLAASFTGHPIEYIVGAVNMAITALTAHLTIRTEVTEFQPSTGDFAALVTLAFLLVLRRLARLKPYRLTTNPAFWLMIVGWVLGFKAVRFWSDWGTPGLLFLVACDLQTLLQLRFKPDSVQRLALVAGIAVTTYLAATSDLGSRWSWTLTKTYTYLKKSDPAVADWLPDKGGILYSASMTTFYDTFYKNPNGDWRYILGYEPVIMPHEDFEVYHKIMWNFGDIKAYQPWVDKMRPIDRLVINAGGKPNIPELEWTNAVPGTWVGRLPQGTNGFPVPSLPSSATVPPTH